MATRSEPLPRGTVTFLFTDVEGSTQLLERLGRDPYRAVLEQHRTVLRRAIAAGGGVEVDCQGDSLLAAFPSSAGALAAAVEAQRALASHGWPEGVQLRVRAGLHTGEASAGEDGYVGIAVHRGRRVCEAAHGGQILLSAATRAVLGAELPGGVELRDLGEVRLAGFEEPERVFAVAAPGLPEAPPGARAPAARGPREEPSLLEREAELAEVDEALAAAAAGSGRLVLLEGPAGIGKSSLLAAARARAESAGFTVLHARGSELESAYSYGVARQLLERLLADAAEAERARLLGGAAAHAAALFASPEDVAGPASEDAAFALLHGLYWLTANLCEHRPLLLVVDDVLWADTPSLRFLAYLARRLEGLSLALLVGSRPLEEQPPPLAELALAARVIRPAALTQAAAADLVRTALSPAADEVFWTACHEATGGNPLLLEELLRTLAAEGVAPRADAVPAVERAAPETVSRSVRLRLSGVAEGSRGLARAVAVLGDGADRRHAAELAGLAPDAVAPAAAELARIGLLRPEAPYAFVHPVIRNAVYESLAPHEREAGHARAAGVLGAAGAPPAQVAAQLLLAPPGSTADAGAMLRDAAGRAAAEGGLDSTAAYLRRALEEPLGDEERSGVLAELGAAELRLGEPSAVERLTEAIPLVGDPERRVEAQLEASRALFWASREAEAVDLLEAALEEHTADDDLRRLLLAERVTNAVRAPGGHEDADRLLAGVDLAAANDPGSRMLLSLQAYRAAFLGRGREQALARARRALAATGRDDEYAWAFWGAVYTLVWADAADDAIRVVDAVLDEARRRGSVFVWSGASMVRAMAGFHGGSLLEAEADARTGLEALPKRQAVFVPNVVGWLGQILVERGSVDEAADVLAEAGVGDAALEETYSHLPLLRARAAVRAARGDPRGALADGLAVGRICVSVGLVNPAVVPWRSDAAVAHQALGASAEATELGAEEVRLARAWGAPRALGRALRAHGLVTGGEDGIATLREAVAVLEPSMAHVEHARALADLGAALRRANRRAEAREPLRHALELAQRCGAGLLAGRAHEELVAAGARPRRLRTSGVDSLTPSERRVSGLAAEGLSNREIAQALFVTLRTVEMHLSNAFRKLDVSSRTELPAALAPEPPA